MPLRLTKFESGRESLEGILRGGILAVVGLLPAASKAGAQATPEPLPVSSEVTLAVGPTVGALDLFAVSDEASLARPALPAPGGFLILPIDLAGRLELHRFDPTRPRRVLTDDGLSRILLPGGTSVFHYRRGDTTFGFLAVGPDGLPRVLLELPGTGPAGTTDPFDPFLAASRDGTRAAIATKLPAGGDVWLLATSGSWLPGGAVAANLGGASPLDVDAGSIAIASGALFFTTSEQTLHRAPADGSSPASPLALPASGGSTPVFVESEIAVSDDGSTVALIAGASEDASDVYVVRPATAAPVNLTQSPGEYQSVDYALSKPFGPSLALGPDGASIAYQKAVGPGNELFLRSTTGGAAVHVTPDSLFEPSIDNVVVITNDALAPALRVDFAAGGGGGSLQSLDLYRADATSGLTVVNLTGTSGSSAPPFPNSASIAIADAFLVPDSTAKAIVSSASGAFSLFLSDVAGGTSTTALTGQAWPGTGVGPAGGRIFFEATATGGAPTIYSLVTGGPPSVQALATAPSGIALESLAVSPAGTLLAFVASAGPGDDFGILLSVPGGAAGVVTPVPATFSRSVAFSPAGVPGFGAAAAPGAPYTFALLGYGGGILPPVPSGTGFFLR